jgi:hypothetical protein
VPKSNTSTWVITVTVVLLAYVLSTGPAMLLMDKGYISSGAVEAFYYPLRMLLPIPGFTKIMSAYLLWWDPGLGHMRA